MKKFFDVRRVRAAAGALVLLSSTAFAQSDASWIGGGSGNWNVPANWSGGFIPANGFPPGSRYNAFIDGGAATNSTVTVTSGSNYTIDNLNVSAGDLLSVQGILNVIGDGNIGTIQNAGTIDVATGFGNLLLGTGRVTLSGTGFTTLATGTIRSDGTFVNSNTIRGNGDIAAAQLFENAGTIISSNTGIRFLDVPNIVNSGRIIASISPVYLGRNIGSVTILNTGTLLASGSTIDIKNVSISGGTLASNSGGRFTYNSQSGEGTFAISNLTNTGTVLIDGNASTLSLGGQITNTGYLSATRFNIGAGTVTLSGSGTLNLSSSGTPLAGGAGTLVNSNRIQGTGTLGVRMINNGEIISTNFGSRLQIAPPGPGLGFINQGTIASGEAFLNIRGGVYDNTAGVIEGRGTTAVEFYDDVTITGGIIRAVDTGRVSFLTTNARLNGSISLTSVNMGGTVLVGGNAIAGGSFSFNASLLQFDPGATFTNNGSMSLGNTTINGALGGTFINNGSIRVNGVTATLAGGSFINNGSVTLSAINGRLATNVMTTELSGAGTLNMENANSRIDGIGTLINNNYIRGQGNVGSNTLAIVNNNQVVADIAASMLTIDPSNAGSAAFRNQGTLASANGGLLVLAGNGGGDFDNAGGTIEARAGSSVALAGGVNVVGGVIRSVGNGIVVTNPGETATLRNVTTSANLSVPSSGTLVLSDTINNANGTLTVNSGGTLSSVGASITSGPIVLNGTWSHRSGSSALISSVRGGGTLDINNATLTIAANGGTVGTSRVGSLSITNGGKFDLTNHDLAIDYTGASPVAGLRTLIESAYAGGAWTGPGLTSSSAAAAASTSTKTALGYGEATDFFGATPTTFSGVNIDATTAVVRYTLAGDANLDLTVNISDFSLLAVNFNNPALWAKGDFNYDGVANISDFALLAANFNQSLPVDLPRQSIPEPAALGLVALVVCVLKRARR